MISNFMAAKFQTQLTNLPVKANQPSQSLQVSPSKLSMPEFLSNLQLGTDPISGPNVDFSTPIEIRKETRDIIAREGIDTSNEEVMAIVRSRARFNVAARNGDIDLDRLGDEYLPHRKGINDPAEKAELDQEVIALAKRLNVKANSEDLTNLQGMEPDQRLQTNTGQADFSTKIAVASAIVALTKDRPDLRERVLTGDGEDPLTVIVAKNPSVRGPNGFANTNDQLFLRSGVLWEDNEINTVMHEFTHVLDGIGLTNKRDGLLPDLSAAEQEQWSGEWKRLKSLNESDPSAPNLRDYAFTNEKEFLAVAVQRFIDSPAQLKKISPVLFDILSNYFNPPQDTR